MFKVEPLVPYAKDYQICIKEAKERTGNAPIKEEIGDISSYEIIYIMSPIYCGTYNNLEKELINNYMADTHTNELEVPDIIRLYRC